MMNEKIGKQIATMRKERGITAERLAEMLSVSPQAVSKWENGKNLPETATLPLLSKALNCSIDAILTPNELQILNATFSDGETSIDVTSIVNAFVNGSRLCLMVSSKALNVDLKSDRLHVLTIKYQISDGIYMVYAIDNSEITIDFNTEKIPFEPSFTVMAAYYGNAVEYTDVMYKMKHYDYFNWGEIHVNHELSPSSTHHDNEEYLTIIYSNESCISVVSCCEGGSLYYSQGKTRLVVKDNSENSYILPSVMMLNWNNKMDCTWAGALYAVMKFRGDNVSYEYIMGVSGACYRIAFTECWDYSSVDALVAFDYAEIGLKALGYEHSWADRIDKSQRQLERQGIIRDIMCGQPPIAINLRIAPEWGVITGFLENGKRLLCRTYFDDEVFAQNKDNPNFAKETGGYLESDVWPWAIEHIGEKIAKPTEKENLLASLQTMIDSAEAEENRGYLQGYQAYQGWIKGLRNDNFFNTLNQEDTMRVLCVNDYQIVNLIDARRCAGIYLRNCTELLGEDCVSEMNALANCYEEIYVKLLEYYERLRHKNGKNIEYNAINSIGASTNIMRTELAKLLEDIQVMEQKAAVSAKKLLNK